MCVPRNQFVTEDERECICVYRGGSVPCNFLIRSLHILQCLQLVLTDHHSLACVSERECVCVSSISSPIITVSPERERNEKERRILSSQSRLERGGNEREKRETASHHFSPLRERGRNERESERREKRETACRHRLPPVSPVRERKRKE